MLCLLRRQWAFSDCVVQIEPPVSEMHMPLPRHCCGIIATANLVEVVLCMIYNLYPRAVVTRDEDKPDDVLVHEELPEFDIVAKLMEGLRIRLLPENADIVCTHDHMYKYDILQVSNPKLTLNPKIG